MSATAWRPPAGSPPPTIWMVAKVAFGSTHWSDPPVTFGPFATREEAEEFARPWSPLAQPGRVYDATEAGS